MNASDPATPPRPGWLNRTVFGIGLASLFCDWAHETASAVLPAFLATLGASAVWLGLIEGISDGLASIAKLGSGYFTDNLQRRKPIAVIGYTVTALGTAAFGLASAAWQVLAARSLAALGRGFRTPVRKALLAGAVDRSAYGRAFGFERMMDTVGAIVGPSTAFLLLHLFHDRYPRLFAATLVPGLTAAVVIALLVQEKARKPVSHISFGERLRLLPSSYKKLLLAVGLFGSGAFAHTLLILLATQKLAPQLGMARAASVAVGLYVLHNIFYAAFGYIAGWLGDRFSKKWLLAFGYFLSCLMTIGIIMLPITIWMLAIIFMLGGTSIALSETLEDAFCAELVDESHQGTAFGLLATVNGLGDFLSSIAVGALWSWAGTSVAFGYSAALCAAGVALVLAIP